MTLPMDPILNGGSSVQSIGMENVASYLIEMCQLLEVDQTQLDKMLKAAQGQLKAPSAEEKSNAPTLGLRVAQQICEKNKGILELLIRETLQTSLKEEPASITFTSTPTDPAEDLYK